MKVDVLCSAPNHPVVPYLKEWIGNCSSKHEVELFHDCSLLSGGEMLFLISVNELVSEKVRSLYHHTLVIHASDLPKGRGWSPHIWHIVEGGSEIVVSLLEAENKVDSGKIWKKVSVRILSHELYDEINHKIFSAEIGLMSYAVDHADTVQPVAQDLSLGVSYWPKRTPENSKINPSESISSQFNLIRVCDPVRYPAFFDLHGCRYSIEIKKV